MLKSFSIAAHRGIRYTYFFDSDEENNDCTYHVSINAMATLSKFQFRFEKSYISADLVERYRDSWSSCIFPHRAVACLADQATRIETKEVVRGTLSFVADDGSTEYSGQVEAIVWNMPGMDFILGLPDICLLYTSPSPRD